MDEPKKRTISEGSYTSGDVSGYGIEGYERDVSSAEQARRMATNDYLVGLETLNRDIQDRLRQERENDVEAQKMARRAQIGNAIAQGLTGIANLGTTIAGGQPMKLADVTGKYADKAERMRQERQRNIEKYRQLSDAASQNRINTLYGMSLDDYRARMDAAKNKLEYDDIQKQWRWKKDERDREIAAQEREEQRKDRESAARIKRDEALAGKYTRDNGSGKKKRPATVAEAISKAGGTPLKVKIDNDNSVYVDQESFEKHIVSRIDDIYNAAMEAAPDEKTKRQIQLSYRLMKSENDKVAFASQFWRYNPQVVEDIARLGNSYASMLDYEGKQPEETEEVDWSQYKIDGEGSAEEDIDWNDFKI